MNLKSGRRSGLETLRDIRRYDSTLPVLVFTGSDERFGEDAVAAGASLFMSKPYQTRDLIAAIDSLVTLQSLRRNITATALEISLLRAAFDAVNVGITLSEESGKVIFENATRRHSSAPSISSVSPPPRWEEVRENDRWVWRNVAEAEFPGRPPLRVTTELEVTRWKIVENIRGQLIRTASTLNCDQLIERVADWLHLDFKYSRVRIWLGNSEALVGHTSRGMWDGFQMKGIPFRLDDKFSAKALAEPRPFMLEGDSFKDDPCYDEFRKAGIRTQLQVPLISVSGVCGIISIDDVGAHRELYIEDIELMSVFGSLVADAIQAARDNDIRKKRQEWTSALNTIDEPLTAGSGLAAVLEVMGKTLAERVRADKGVVMTRERVDAPLRIVSVIDGGDPGLIGVEHGGHGMIGQCMEHKQIVFEKNVWDRPGFRECYNELRDDPWGRFLSDAKSVVVEPILCGSDVIGVLFLRSSEQMQIDEIDEFYLTAVAKRVSIALAKLDEYQRIEATLIQQSKLHDLAMLSAGVAHGMRNPLTTVQFALDYLDGELKSGAVSSDVLGERIAKIRTATESSLMTLDRLLSWCAPQGSTPAPLNVSILLDKLIKMVEAELNFRNISIHYRPIDDSSYWIRGASDQLRMTLVDLFWNAAKAMPNGGDLYVSLQMSEDMKFVELGVRDTGSGMSDECLAKQMSFPPFSPVPAGGPGLGLYLCQKILKAHGGMLRIASYPNSGTTMTAILPIDQRGERHEL